MATDQTLLYDRLIGEVTYDGFHCLLFMSLEYPTPISTDALLQYCRIRDTRTLKPALKRCQDYGYAAPVAPLDGTRWTLTDIFKRVFGELLAALASVFGLRAHTHSAQPLSPQATEQLSLTCVESTQPLFLSDQIIDHDQKSDHDQIQKERDVQAIADLLDRHGVYEPKRSKLLADGWVTVERIEAALYRSQHNRKRTSANPVPLAIAELLDARYRPAIEATAAQLRTTPSAEISAEVLPVSEPERRIDTRPILKPLGAT